MTRGDADARAGGRGGRRVGALAFRARRKLLTPRLMTSASPSDDGELPTRTLIAAAATGTPAAGEPPPAREPLSEQEREFRLRADETIADGIRRVARGQLAAGSDALAAASGNAELGEAVHSTRKSIKRVRATLRLSRATLGEDAYARENAHMRTIARRLSGARDAHVLIETLDALEERFEADLAPGAGEKLRARLEDDAIRAMAALGDDGDVAVTTRQALEQARERTTRWSFAGEDLAAIAAGLRRVYSRGRKRMRAACEEPSAERLHEARKRVKDLWHASELLHEAHPKRMRRLARDAHALSGLLGDHHDLSVLREYIESNPQLFSDMTARESLLAVLDRRSEKLQRRALKLGRRLYERKPKRFVADIERGWSTRVGDPPGPGAG